jgi:uncharacterized protein YukE
MAAGLAARLTAMRDGYVKQLDDSLREVRGDPAALRKLKGDLAPEAKLANTTGEQATQHAGAAQSGWQGDAYASMRARVQGTAAEFNDSSTVLTKAADGFERAADALEKATADIEKAKQTFTGAADGLIQQGQQVPPPQEASAGQALTQNMDGRGKQATTAKDNALKRFDSEMAAIYNGVGPGKTAKAGQAGGQRYVMYPNGEARVGGDRAWRNNNPGNLQYGQRAQRFGSIGPDDGNNRDRSKGQLPFAVFPDKESGEAAMRDLIRSEYKNKTLPEALTKYAPSSENNIPAYVDTVERQSGLDVRNRLIGSYTPEEFDRLIGGMKHHESGRPGTIYSRDNAPAWLLPLFGP